MMLKLYGSDRSRAAIIKWYLAEIGAEYEFVTLDMQNGEHLQPAFLAINPIGKVPAITEDDFKLWESGAILLYLAEKQGQLPNDLHQKALIYQWMFFTNSTLAAGLFSEMRSQTMPRLLSPLNDILQNQEFILASGFSVADVALGSVLSYIPMMFKDVDLQPYAGILAYLQHLSDRPAFKSTIGAR